MELNRVEQVKLYRSHFPQAGLREAVNAIDAGWKVGDTDDWYKTARIRTDRDDENEQYRTQMDMPIECLGVALYGVEGNDTRLKDYEIVDEAIKKIALLKKLLIASGMNENMLDIIMKG